MKILISADMEGATGVTWPAGVEPGTEQWQRCRRTFTSDVNAAAVVPTVERIGERSVAYTSGSAWEMIRCFKAVTTLIASATEDFYG